MFYLVSFFAIAFFIITVFTERYDFAYHHHSKRYCARLGLVGFMILQVAVHTENEPLMAIGLVPTCLSTAILLMITYLDYQREHRMVPWFDREGL